MNIVFYVLVAIAIFILYFILSSTFGVIGNFASKTWNELVTNIKGEDEHGKE